MRKTIGLAIIASILTININAEGTKPKKFYIGIGIGNMKYHDDGLVSNNLDDKNSGTKLYLGFQFNKITSIEYSYIDYGEYKSYIISQKFKEHKLGVNFGYPLKNEELRPFVNVGLASISRDITSGYVYQSDDGGFGLAFGLGVQYEPKFLKGVGVRVGYDSSLFSQEIGAYTYDQRLDMTYIALQYKF